MQRVLNHLGIDIGSESLSVSNDREATGASRALDYPNNLEGFSPLRSWMEQQQMSSQNTILCMEASGVYTESLCYYFSQQGFSLVVEAPKKTKQAFHAEAKNDHIDARQLGEYAFRYFDKLRLWSPQFELVEQVNTLLSVREQLSQQRTAHRNQLKAFQRKVIQTPFATEMLHNTIAELEQKIRDLEKELRRLFAQHPEDQQKLQPLDSMKSVGFLLSTNLFAFVGGFQESWNPKKIAARLGIVPRQHQSGTSVYRKPRSRREGHSRIRKLLYLAAMNLIQHDLYFKQYYLRLEQQGKSRRLILNNIANKVIKILCTLVNSHSPFIQNYQSLNPALLKT